MAKKKSELDELHEVKAEKPVTLESVRADVGAPTVKIVHMHAGCDLIGSQTSHNAKHADLFETTHGILMVSKKTKRKVMIPYSNIRAYELL